jgi:hypothetical protein
MTEVEKVARALARLQIQRNCRYDNPPPSEDRISAGVDHVWPDFVPQAEAALAALTGAEAKPRFRHIKRGTTYTLVGPARIQTDEPLADMSFVTVYRCEQTGALWARRTAEFTDGRFERIEDATPPPSRAEVGEECARHLETLAYGFPYPGGISRGEDYIDAASDIRKLKG